MNSATKRGRGDVTRPAPETVDNRSIPRDAGGNDVSRVRQAAADLDHIYRAGRRDDVTARLIIAYAERRQRVESRTLRDALHDDGIACDLAALMGLRAGDVANIIDDQHRGDRVAIVAGVLREMAAEIDQAEPIDRTPRTRHAAVERAHRAATSKTGARR